MRLAVGYVATPGGFDALALAIRFARTLGAEVDICIVLPSDTGLPGLVPKGGFDEVLTEQARSWLDEALVLVPDDVIARTHLSFSESFAEGLIHEAARLNADAIVVGSSGGGLAGSYSLGSVVNELLHSSPVPVAVAPRGTRESKVERVREVTCALGNRAGAARLLDTAIRASKAAGAPLRLVSLVALDPAFGSSGSGGSTVHERAQEHVRTTLETAKARLPKGFPVSAVVVDGPTVEAAVNKLEWQHGDVIMVGSSRLSAPRRIFLGSTAAKMLRALNVPMVVVPRDYSSEELS